jgi:adenylate cyclase
MRLSKPISLWLAPALILALGVLVLLFDPFSWESALANRLFDSWQRHRPLAAHTAPRVVALDLPALDEETMAAAVRTLAQSGAKTVVLAAPPAPEPSPRRLIAKLPPDSKAAAILSGLPEPGARLAAAASGLALVVPVTLGRAADRTPAIKARFLYRGSRDPFAKVPRFTAGAGPGPALEAAAAGEGAANLVPDSDGVVRRLPIALRLGDVLMPSLAAEALRVIEHRPAITVTTDERDPLTLLRGVGIGAMRMDGTSLPTAPDGSMWLRWGGVEHITMARPGDLRGAVVVMGPPGANFHTPPGPDTAAGVTANALNTMLQGAAPVRPVWLHLIEALLLVLLGGALLAALQRGVSWAAALLVVTLPVLFLSAWLAFAHGGLLLDAATPAVALVLAFIAAALAYANELRMIRAGLRLAFADSLPGTTVGRIARSPALLTTDGETRDVTYLACGVRGLTALATRYRDDAAGFTHLMRQTLAPLIDQALAHGGTIDRLAADGFAAFWNAPLDDPQHALHACAAAAAIADTFSRIAGEIAAEADQNAIPVEIGIGLASGPVIAGSFSGHGRMGYSVNGEAVALAQRIQARSHQYGPSVIAAAGTRAATDSGFAWLEIDTIAAGASDPAVTLFAMTGNPVMRASPKFRALTVFHDHIFQAIRKQQWAMARELIAQCRRLSGASQKMYDLYLSRIAWYEKHPPGENWDGAFRPVRE